MIEARPIKLVDVRLHAPRSAASTPVQALADAAESALATVEYMESLKRTSSTEYDRARTIAMTMLWHLKLFNVSAADLVCVKAYRVSDILFPTV